MVDDRPIYLNNAATTWPKPPEVIRAAAEVFTFPFLEHGRTTAKGGTDYAEEARETLAQFFSVSDPAHIIFTLNATDSLNMLIHGFARAGREKFHAITTDLEHNSVLRPLRTLERDGKLQLTVVSAANPGVLPEQVADEIRHETALIVVGHGSNVLGSVQDIRSIGRIARESGVFFIVDGAQTAGQYPVDLSSTDVDAFVFTGHKALFGFPGTGGFYIRDPGRVAPVRQGGTGVDSSARFHPEELPLRFESGTPNYPGLASLTAGVRFVSSRGIETIMAQTAEMTSGILSELSGIEGISIFNPRPELPVITFSIHGIDNEDAGFILMKAYNIVVRTGLHCAPLIHERMNGGTGGIRMSLSCMNTPHECRIAAAAVREIAAGIRSDGR